MVLKPRHWKALRWFRDKDGAHMFGSGDPTLATVRELLEAKLLRPDGVRAGWSRYCISEMGRELLEGKTAS